MKLLFITFVLLVIGFSSLVYGENPNEFGYRLLPAKIVENSEGILEVYVKDESKINSIENLVVTSSDSSIIQILGIDKNENNIITNVKIKTLHAGTANIALAAPGFLSYEFPLTVYGNKHHPVQFLIKTTPNTFLIDGPTKGYVSIELADQDGFPTRATNDVSVTLSTSKNDVVNLENKDLIIKKGEYFMIGEFQINKPGDVLIYASSPSMETVSSNVIVSKTSTPLTVHLYVYPNKITNFAGSYGYAIVQLQDSSGNPVIAKETIPVSLKISSTDKTIVNTSGNYPGIVADKVLEIKKGSYWGYTTLAIRAGQEGAYNIGISAKDFLVSSSTQLETKNIQFVDDKSAKLDTVPILATGKEELIGVMHLEDKDANPVMASKDLQIGFDSLDEKSLSAKNIIIHRGTGVALVFGKVGYTKPDTLTLRVLNDENPTVTPVIYVPSLKLVAEPLIQKILSQTDFPLLLYMLQDNGEITYFPKNIELSVSPNEFIQVEPKMISKDQSVVLLNAKSLKPGSATISLQADDFAASVSVDNLYPKPPMIHLDYPGTILTNLKNTFSIQLLDEQQVPIFADQDMEIRLVSNDKSVIDVPESVIIKKGSYYTFFDAKTKEIGKAEIAALATDLPMSKFDLDVKSIIPQITISSPDYINPNTNFDITITAQYLNSPLSEMNVEWNVQGAVIQDMDSITDKNGNAKISLLSQDPSKISVDASVSGGIFSSARVNKQINVNQPLVPVTSPATSNKNTSGIFGIDPLIVILVPVLAVGGIILKKKNMFDGMTEKISSNEMISEIKERISQLRHRSQ